MIYYCIVVDNFLKSIHTYMEAFEANIMSLTQTDVFVMQTFPSIFWFMTIHTYN